MEISKVSGIGENINGFSDGNSTEKIGKKNIWTGQFSNNDLTDTEITINYKKAKKAYEEGMKLPNTPEGHKKLEQDYLNAKEKWETSTPEGITQRYKDAKKAYEQGMKMPNTPEGHKKLEQDYLNAKEKWELISN